jgi:phytoene/squalene synthetase
MTADEREQLIKDINVLLHQAYDSTLDEIYALLKRIDDVEDEQDLKAIKEAREDIRINGTVSWDEIQNEIRNEINKDVA